MRLLRPSACAALNSLILATVLLTGCINEGNLDCPDDTGRGVTVRFVYDYHASRNDNFPTVVNTVELYIYDQHGLLHELVEYTESQLKASDYKPKILLDPGRYTFVSWMNRSEAYDVSNFEDYATATLSLKTTRGTPDYNDPAPIFYASAQTEVVTMDEEVTMSFMKNTSFIRVNMIFNEQLPHDVDIYSYITARHGTYNFRNEQSSSDILNYIPRTVSTYATQTIVNEYTVERITAGDDMELFIYQTRDNVERQIKRLELVPLIMQNPDYNTQEKLDINELFEITLHLEYVDSALVVTQIYIDGWKIVDNETGI